MGSVNMKKIIILVGCFIAVIICAVSMYFYGLTSVSKKSEVVEFNVSKGMNTSKIIDSLKDAGLIRSKLSSKIYMKLHKNIVIKAGVYNLDRSQSTKEIFNTLNSSKASLKDTIKVTFLEGKRLTDYISVIKDNFGYSEDEILSILNDKDYLNSLIDKYDFLDKSILNSDIYYPLEGYLFPDTYEFYKNASVKDVVEKMLDKMDKVLDNYNVSLKETKYNVHEILTIASIIENESMVASDREIVSQVIYKRLSMNMSLGMDVTTYYGVKKALSETLTSSDLNTKNAYNTRNKEFIGLPVGPICNPSSKAILAALNPSDTEYVYFYADIYGKGGTAGKLYFAKTYNEFQELIRKYS